MFISTGRISMMALRNRSLRGLVFAFLLLSSLAACNSLVAPEATPTIVEQTVESSLRVQLVGRWELNGVSEPTRVEFHQDGGVTVEKVESGENQLGSFRFISENTIVIEETDLAGRGEVAFSDDRLTLTLMRPGEPFGQIIGGERILEESSADSESSSDEGTFVGVQVYHEMGCGACHSLEMAGSEGVVGPALEDMAALAAERIESPDYTGNATTPEEYIWESIVEPSAHVVESYPNVMPPYATIPEEDVEAMIELLLQQ
jgi:hypothetical protein